MFTLYILAAIVVTLTVIALFTSPSYKTMEYTLTTFFSTLFIGCIVNLLINIVIASNSEQELYSTEVYPIAKIEGYEKYAFVKHNGQSTDINLTYIDEDQPVSITERLYSVKIYDLEPNEKPSVVFKYYRLKDTNWTFCTWNDKIRELHINQDQIGVIYEKQKKPKIEKE